jgi:FkbM family methyltransferase
VSKQLVRGHYEQAEQKLIAKYMNPQIPVLELGGSMGVLSAYIGLVLEPTVPHTIVEADSKLLPVLERNAFARDNGKSTRIIHAAVSSMHEETHWSSFEQQGQTDKARKTNLSRLSEGLKRYTLVMDIDGAEFDILRNDAAGLSACELAIITVKSDQAGSGTGHGERDFVKLAKNAHLHHIETLDNVLVFKPDRSLADQD